MPLLRHCRHGIGHEPLPPHEAAFSFVAAITPFTSLSLSRLPLVAQLFSPLAAFADFAAPLMFVTQCYLSAPPRLAELMPCRYWRVISAALVANSVTREAPISLVMTSPEVNLRSGHITILSEQDAPRITPLNTPDATPPPRR